MSRKMKSSNHGSLPLLDRVLDLDVDDAVIDYMISSVCSAVRLQADPAPSHEMGGHIGQIRSESTTVQTSDRTLNSREAASRRSKAFASRKKSLGLTKQELPSLADFIANISVRSRCTMSTMVVALIYLERLEKVIRTRPPAAKKCSRHRVIFSCIMLSHKIWNDSSMVGKHWAEVSTMFASQEVLAMEREVLLLLRYDLEVTAEEIWKTARAFMSAPWLELSKSERECVCKYERQFTVKAFDDSCTMESQQQLVPTHYPAGDIYYATPSISHDIMPLCLPEPSCLQVPVVPSHTDRFEPAPAASSAQVAIVTTNGPYTCIDPSISSFGSAVNTASCTYTAPYPQVPFVAADTCLSYAQSSEHISECIATSFSTGTQLNSATSSLCSFMPEERHVDATISSRQLLLPGPVSTLRNEHHLIEHELPHMKSHVVQLVPSSSSESGNASRASRPIYPSAAPARLQRCVDGCGHVHQVMSQATRLKKRRSINAMQFHLPSGMIHPYSSLRSLSQSSFGATCISDASTPSTPASSASNSSLYASSLSSSSASLVSITSKDGLSPFLRTSRTLSRKKSLLGANKATTLDTTVTTITAITSVSSNSTSTYLQNPVGLERQWNNLIQK